VKNWLDRYFSGGKPDPRELPLLPEGSPFRKVIWQLLLTIPYGETRTYGDLAREAAAVLGKENMSAQAVGGAVGANPISVIIPCHRVIAAGGKLGGFGWGPDAKKWLLRHEGGNYDDQRISDARYEDPESGPEQTGCADQRSHGALRRVR
jgi:methylated-DNA-[protein]-cysteine S-methyltransferase